jgi:molybdopterin-containing oxidoreductase family membrane subunit
MFYDLIIVGQLIPHFQAYDLFGYPEFYSYRPSLHELIMGAGAIGFFFTTYLLGEILFKNGR